LFLVKKRYRRLKLYLYIQLEKAHAKKMAFIYQVIRWFAPKSQKEYVLNMNKRFELFAKIWSEKFL